MLCTSALQQLACNKLIMAHVVMVLTLQVAYSHHVNSTQVDCHDLIVGNLPISKMQHEVDNIVIAVSHLASHAVACCLKELGSAAHVLATQHPVRRNATTFPRKICQR